MYDHGNDEMSLFTSSTQRVTIGSGGEVGIGTTSPQRLLHVYANSSGDTAVIRIQDNGSHVAGIELYSGHGNWGIYNSDTVGDALEFRDDSAGSTRMLINSSGLVGIGTTAPHELLHVEGGDGTQALVAVKEDTATATASYMFKVDSTGTDVRKKAGLIFQRDDPGTRGTGVLHICLDGVNDEGSASIADSKMRFSADGEISITSGRTNFSAEASAFAPGNHNGHAIDINGQSFSGRAATNAQTHRAFLNPNGTVGEIQTNGSATSYNTSSDYRLKENVVTDWDGTTLLKQLKPSKFNFKTDASTTLQGFLAHEVSSIVPQAVSGEKDAVYTAEEAAENSLAVEGQPNYQQIDHSKLVPLLVKTIQELEARIEALES